MENIQLIVSCFTCIGVVISLVNLILLRRNFLASHERTRKQATIDFYHDLKNRSTEIEQWLFSEFMHGSTQIDLNEIDDDLSFKIRSYLSILEQFSTGVNLGIYDVTVTYRLSGTSLINTYNQLKPYITAMRKERNEPILYKEFELLTIKLQQINYQPPDVGGELKYSPQDDYNVKI